MNKKKNNRVTRISEKHIFIVLAIAACFFIISLFNSRSKTTETLDFEDPFHLKSKIPKTQSNPPPPRHVNDLSSLYIAIFDDAYEEKPYHPIIYEQWISKLSEEPFIDGIEMYSLTKWKCQTCNLSTIVVKNPPKFMSDPRSWQLHQTLLGFLERSDSGWLFLVGDAAYIHLENFIRFIRHEVLTHYSSDSITFKGSCIEPRYFFQALQISSGILISRSVVEKITELDEFWHANFEMMMDPDEALSHAFCQLNACADLGIKAGFIGDAFKEKSDFDVLMNGRTADLPACKLPDYLANPPPGIAGNCVKFAWKFSEIISWAGGGKDNKFEFLNNADRMVSSIRSEYGIIWEKTRPRLCRFE